MVLTNDRLQPVVQRQNKRQVDDATDNAQESQNPQRESHNAGAFMHMSVDLLVLGLAMEGQEHSAEAVDGREQCGHCADGIEQNVVVQRGHQDRVLRKEAREQRNTCERRCADQKGSIGRRHLLSETAQAVHVQDTVGGVHDAASSEEEQCFEKSVRDQMEKCGAIGSHARRRDHVTEL